MKQPRFIGLVRDAGDIDAALRRASDELIVTLMDNIDAQIRSLQRFQTALCMEAQRRNRKGGEAS